MERDTGWSGALEFRTLGALDVRVSGSTVDIGGHRQRRLLAVLLSRAGSVVPADALAEWVWDDGDRPGDGVRAIRTYVSRLRKALGEAGADAERVVVTESPGYRLAVGEGQLDSARFEWLVAAARSLLDGTDPSAAVARLDEALSLWRGEPFAEFADRDWVEAEVARLQELHTVATEERAAARLALGAHGEVVGDLERLITQHPLRARPVELLLVALFRGDRQADALRAATRYREALADVGLEPSVAIAELESRIAASDASLLRVDDGTQAIRTYELAERIGEGAFSIVYRGVQPSLGREVAIKQIRAELANRPEFIRRFEAEAHMVACLEHPYIVPLYDYWREPGAAFLVMRWLRGGTLEAALADHPLGLREVSTLVTQVGSALAASHREGVVHRDVKSANVFLDETGNNYLGDFGIAVASAEAADPAAQLSAGSPAYAAPEQLRREAVGPAADVYGLGIVVFEALIGHLPFPNERSQAALLQRQLHDPIPSVSELRPEVAPAVDEVLARATAKSACDRYPEVAEFVDALGEALDRSGQSAPAHWALSRTTIALDSPNPYKGLRSFQEADAAEFFGRDRLVDRLVDQLVADGPEGRLVVAVGPSGSGKSSVVRAGLVPRVRSGAIPGSDSWFVATMIPGADPFGELEAALVRVSASSVAGLADQMRVEKRGIARAVKAVLPDESTELLLVVDQLEELFTQAAEDDRRAFVAGMAEAVTDPRSRLRVVATLRADFWDRPLRHPEIARILETSAVTVTPLAADELEQAIVEPADRVGVGLEPGLVAEMVADVHDQPGALPLLQYALTELYDRRTSALMELATYRELGGIAGALARRAEELYESTPAEHQHGIQTLFTRLVTPGEGVEDTRRRVMRSELTMVPADIIDRYGEARLLSFDIDPATREPTVEVAHEALIREWPRLRRWVDEDRDGLRTLRHLTTTAHNWDEAGRPDHELYRGGRLEATEHLVEGSPDELTELERRFLEASTAGRDEEKRTERRRLRRLRSLLAAAAVVAAIAIVAGLVALDQRSRAQDQTALAEQRAAEALEAVEAEQSAVRDAELRRIIAQASQSPAPLSFLLALEALRLDEGGNAGLGALLGTLQRTDGFLGSMPDSISGGDAWLGFLDDTHLVVRTVRSVDLYDINERRRISSWDAGAPDGITRGAAAGGVFATTTDAGDVVWLSSDSSQLSTLARTSHVKASAVGVSPDGSLIVGYANGLVEVRSGQDFTEQRTVGRHFEPIVGVALDMANRVAVSTDEVLSMAVWELDDVAAAPRWTVTLSARDRWVTDGAIQGWLGVLGAGQFGVILGGPPPTDTGPSFSFFVFPPALSPSGDVIYWPFLDEVHAVDAHSGQALGTVRLSDGSGHMQVLDDGRVLFHDTILRPAGPAWDGKDAQALDLPNSILWTAMSPDRSVIAARAIRELSLWSTDGDQLLAQGVPRAGMDAAVLNADATRVVTLLHSPRQDTPVIVRDVASGDDITPFESIWISFTAQGQLVRWPGGVLTLYDPDTMEPIGVPFSPESIGWGTFDVTPDERLVVLGDISKHEIRVYDLATGERVETLAVPRTPLIGGVFYMDMSLDGRHVAASVIDTVLVWDTATWEIEHQLEPPEGDIYGEVRFTPDSHALAMGAGDRVDLYDLENMQITPVVTRTPGTSGVYHIHSLDFSADGRYLVSAGTNGASLTDLQANELIGPEFPHDLATGGSVAPGATHVVTGVDETILVWNLDVESWPEIACRAAGRNMTLQEWEQFGPVGEPYNATCPQWPDPSA